MSTFAQLQRQSRGTSSSLAPTSSLLRPSRPFTPVSPVNTQQARFAPAPRFGHSLNQISVYPQHNSALSQTIDEEQTSHDTSEPEGGRDEQEGAEQVPGQDAVPDAASDEGQPAALEETTLLDDRSLQSEQLLTTPQPIEILDHLHTIEYRKVNGQIVPGISSNWVEVDQIYQELRRRNLLVGHPEVSEYHALVRSRNKVFQESAEEVEKYSAKISALRFPLGPAKTIGKATSSKRAKEKQAKVRKQIKELQDLRYEEGRHKSLLEEQLNAAIRWFIQAAIAVNSTVVAEVLGAAMPPITFPTDVTHATQPNHFRYHTGKQNDPIPITWYKPENQYLNITVHNSATNAQVTLTPRGPNPPVTDPQGSVYHFGVNPANFALNQIWRNTPRHGSDRGVQRRLNDALTRLGYDPSQHHEDGDHVRDLGFSGSDDITNYWPLDSTTNRLSFNGWRSLYYLNYKKRQRPNTDWELEKAPLNSGTLVGLYFRSVREEASITPQGNNSPASGSDTTWGNAGTVLAPDGTRIAEG